MAEIESQTTTSIPKPPVIPGREPAPPPPAQTTQMVPADQGKALTHPAPVQVMADKIGLNFTVKTFKPDGTSESITIPLPDSPNFEAWTFAQQVGMLKNGVWKDQSLQDIIFGLAYAKHIGAEVLEGELFPTGNGRWGTSNKYKIKKGFATGKIEGYTTETKELDQPLPPAMADKCVQKKDLECTVTLEVKGFNKPIIRRARLSRWFTASNPNWGSRPEHMLELNTLAHAMEFLVPGETDEAPLTAEKLVESPVPTVEDLKRQRDAQRAPSPGPPPSTIPPTVQTLEGGLPDPTEIDNLLTDIANEGESVEKVST